MHYAETIRQKIVFKKIRAKSVYDLYMDLKNIQLPQVSPPIFTQNREEDIHARQLYKGKNPQLIKAA